MNFLLLGGFANGMLGFLMAFLSLFLIMLILIQRGKGGGLTGALGGPGGQSAFGSKAGDTFTLVTVVVASIWGFTCAFAMWLNVDTGSDSLGIDQAAAVQGAGSDGTSSGVDGETDTSTEIEPGLSQGGELSSPGIGAPAEAEKPVEPADEPAAPEKPADEPAAPEKPADEPAKTDSTEAVGSEDKN